jgi:hypothetical protein
VEDTLRIALAFRADTYWLFIEPLSSLEAGVAESAFIFVDRHQILDTTDSSISNLLKQISHLPL